MKNSHLEQYSACTTGGATSMIGQCVSVSLISSLNIQIKAVNKIK